MRFGITKSKMRAITVLLTVALAACIVQTCRANIFNKLTDKITDKVIGGDGDDDKDKDKDKDGKEDKLYQGGIAKQLLHSVSDAAIDRLSVEAQERSDIGGKLGDTAIKMISSKIKHAVHEKINSAGEEEKPKEEDKPKEEQPQQQPPPPPAQEGEPAPPAPEPVTVASPAEEKKGGLAGLLDKFTRRR